MIKDHQKKHWIRLGFRIINLYLTQKEKTSEFVKLWQKSLASLPDKIQDLMKPSDQEFTIMLKAVLSALAVENINPKFLTGVVGGYSFAYKSPSNGKKYGLIWSNTPNGKSFYTVMKKCEEVMINKSCQKLFIMTNEQ